MTIQCILFFASFLFSNEESNIEKFLSQDEVLISIIVAVCNGSLQFTRIYLEAHAVKETFIQHALNCAMGRVKWLPFEKKLVSFLRETYDREEEKEKDQQVAADTHKQEAADDQHHQHDQHDQHQQQKSLTNGTNNHPHDHHHHTDKESHDHTHKHDHHCIFHTLSFKISYPIPIFNWLFGLCGGMYVNMHAFNYHCNCTFFVFFFLFIWFVFFELFDS